MSTSELGTVDINYLHLAYNSLCTVNIHGHNINIIKGFSFPFFYSALTGGPCVLSRPCQLHPPSPPYSIRTILYSFYQITAFVYLYFLGWFNLQKLLLPKCIYVYIYIFFGSTLPPRFCSKYTISVFKTFAFCWLATLSKIKLNICYIKYVYCASTVLYSICTSVYKNGLSGTVQLSTILYNVQYIYRNG